MTRQRKEQMAMKPKINQKPPVQDEFQDDPKLIECYGEPFNRRSKSFYEIRPNFFAWKFMIPKLHF